MRCTCRCSCDEDYIGDECEISTILAIGDTFDGVLHVAIPGQFPSLRAALASTPENETRVFEFSPGIYTGMDNILGTENSLQLAAGLQLVSTGSSEDTIFDCQGVEGGFLAIQDSVDIVFSMEVRNVHSEMYRPFVQPCCGHFGFSFHLLARRWYQRLFSDSTAAFVFV